jgi:hypothetical protein
LGVRKFIVSELHDYLALLALATARPARTGVVRRQVARRQGTHPQHVISWRPLRRQAGLQYRPAARSMKGHTHRPEPGPLRHRRAAPCQIIWSPITRMRRFVVLHEGRHLPGLAIDQVHWRDRRRLPPAGRRRLRRLGTGRLQTSMVCPIAPDHPITASDGVLPKGKRPVDDQRQLRIAGNGSRTHRLQLWSPIPSHRLSTHETMKLFLKIEAGIRWPAFDIVLRGCPR